MSKKPVAEYDQFQLRLPPGLRERIAVAAKENGRSMNSEIVNTLEAIYPDIDVKHILKTMRMIREHIDEFGLTRLNTEALKLEFDSLYKLALSKKAIKKEK